MTGPPQTYHQRVSEEKRAAIIAAAVSLFLERGYAETSLARIAEVARVSTATLFKQFPTKAELFAAMVVQYWQLSDAGLHAPAAGDPAAGLQMLGERYVELMSREEMVALFRIVIAEAPRFPDLAEAQFTLGKAPFFNSVKSYLGDEHAAGTLDCPDPELAATQFLGMISNFAFWPRLLLVAWHPNSEELHRTVAEAARAIIARYGLRT
ncbi:TetR/AcrR family transcriptional regulator [Mycobacterium stomatepiae]|uniref:TetR family transcriptional regulator n=1 Tax=Mycobacterium stomatepiae TaxID=470076 RepID=A0A7I7Q9B1_9MYCO|nr:TetR/AcrR family transcriptional regulator [Mycobacterium stomatepiae]MCV7164473.1 TetR/AcrR family transcriptional regulator [Mycobacterium stomatepiae]BBY22895.1 TetR family transcriptional regulator [Mycobacterium stomatepiae]